MVMTRQSAHILMASSRLSLAGNIQCRPSSFAAILSIVLLTPNGLLQRMQSAGSSSLMICVRAVAAREVDLRRQRDDLFRAGALAQPALDAGVFDKFERRAFGIVEQRTGRTYRYAGLGTACIRSTLTLIAPSGAPSGSAITSVGAGATRCSSLRAKRSRSRRLPTVLKVAGGLTVARGFDPAQRLAERIRIVRLDRGNTAPGKSEAGKNGFGHRDRLRKSGDVVQGLGAQKETHARRAVGECRRRSLPGRPALPR